MTRKKQDRSRKSTYIRDDHHKTLVVRKRETGVSIENQLDDLLNLAFRTRRIPIVTMDVDAIHMQGKAPKHQLQEVKSHA